MMRRPRCGDGSYILMISVTDAELVMLVAHGGALAALGDVAGCAGNVCRVSWCPIALLCASRPTPFIASTLARFLRDGFATKIESLESTVLRRPRRKESCFCCCPPRLITIVAHRLRHFHRRRTSRSSFHCSISHIAPFCSRCAHAVSSAALRQCGTRQLRRVVYDRPLHGVRSGRPCLLVVDHSSLG